MIETMLRQGIKDIASKISSEVKQDTFVAIFSNVDGKVTIKNSAGEVISSKTLKEHGVELPNMLMDTLIVSVFDTHTRMVAIKSGRELFRFNS